MNYFFNFNYSKIKFFEQVFGPILAPRVKRVDFSLQGLHDFFISTTLKNVQNIGHILEIVQAKLVDELVIVTNSSNALPM